MAPRGYYCEFGFTGCPCFARAKAELKNGFYDIPKATTREASRGVQKIGLWLKGALRFAQSTIMNSAVVKVKRALPKNCVLKDQPRSQERLMLLLVRYQVRNRLYRTARK
jgi:hypothetical protein